MFSNLSAKFDFFRHRHTVLGDAGRAEGLLDHNIAALGTECDLDGIGENVDAAQNAVTRVGGKRTSLAAIVNAPNVQERGR